MVLVDTSVWVHHFRYGNQNLRELLSENDVLIHPFVIGELACGTPKKRKEEVQLMQHLPQAEVSSHEETLRFVEGHHLYGKGIGWVDVHLLASTLLSDVHLWTLDKQLLKCATSMRIQHLA